MAMRLICLAAGFACGCIPTGFIIGIANGVDIRKKGSGNIGTTNVLRTLGRGWALATLAGDMLKAVVPIVIMQMVFGTDHSMRYLVTMYAGLGAILGHDFSPFLKFNGGKGIATSGGMLLITDPRLFFLDLITVFAVTIATGYVSLGSIMGSVFYIIFHLAVILAGFTPGWGFYPQYFDRVFSAEVMVLALVMAGIAIYRHKANIIRLLNGTENKTSLKGKKKQQA